MDDVLTGAQMRCVIRRSREVPIFALTQPKCAYLSMPYSAHYVQVGLDLGNPGSPDVMLVAFGRREDVEWNTVFWMTKNNVI